MTIIRTLLLVALATPLPSQTTPQTASEVLAQLPGPRKQGPIDRRVLGLMREAKVPGMAAAIVKDGKVAWVRGYGWADMERRVPVDGDTLFQAASVSKTVTSYAIMQAVEKGALSLDADINKALSFKVRNPRHPDVKITLRQLLTHTSGIRDNWPLLERTWVQDKDFPKTLGRSLESYFTSGQPYFDERRNFYRWGPGQKHDYSNVGIALAALAAEHTEGKPFEELCEARIFAPLGMKGPAFRLRHLEKSARVAVPYELKRRATRFKRLGHHGYLDFPSGTLRISARDLARFLLTFIEDGELDGVRLLKASTVAEMKRVAFPKVAPDQCIIWFRDKIGGQITMGHDGSDPGVSTAMSYRLKDGVGVLSLMNGAPRKRRFDATLATELFNDARTL